MQVSAHGGWGSMRGSKLVLHHRKPEKLWADVPAPQWSLGVSQHSGSTQGGFGKI
ncbi:unnamed protein product, partial [Gulo gulo]